MWVPSIFGNVSSSPEDSCVTFNSWNTSFTEAFYDFSMLGNHIIYRPNWDLLGSPGVLWLTIWTVGINQDCPRETGVYCWPTSRQSWVFSYLSCKAPLSIRCTSWIHMSTLLLVWELHQSGAGPRYLCISSISPVPGTEMTQRVINESKCLFNKLSELIRKIRCLHLDQQFFFFNSHYLFSVQTILPLLVKERCIWEQNFHRKILSLRLTAVNQQIATYSAQSTLQA